MPNKPIRFDFQADTDKYERSVSDAADETEKLEKAIKDIPKATDRMAREGKKDFDKIGDEAADAGRETGQEFRQNLGESLASGGGIGDILTDTVGGLISSLEGPLGLAAAAIGAGTLLVFNKFKEQVEQFNQAVAEQTQSMWSSAMDSISGKVGQVGIHITNALLAQQELTRLWQDSPEEMEKLVGAAKDLGINAWDIVAARAGDEEAIKRVQDALDDVYAKQNAGYDITVDTVQAVDTIEQGLGKAETAQKKWNAQAQAYNDSIAPGAQTLANMKSDLEWIKQNGSDALRMKVSVDSSQLKQYFPYGTVGGTGIYKPLDGGAS